MSQTIMKGLPLSQSDPDVHAILQKENRRQEESLILIASENYVSKAVLRPLPVR